MALLTLSMTLCSPDMESRTSEMFSLIASFSALSASIRTSCAALMAAMAASDSSSHIFMRAADASGSNKFAGFDMDANLRQRVAELVFSVVLADGEGERLELSGTIERNKAPRLLDGVTADSGVQATLEGGLGSTAVAELAVLFDARFSGQLSAGLRITGTVGEPTLQGLLEFAAGR